MTTNHSHLGSPRINSWEDVTLKLRSAFMEIRKEYSTAAGKLLVLAEISDGRIERIKLEGDVESDAEYLEMLSKHLIGRKYEIGDLEAAMLELSLAGIVPKGFNEQELVEALLEG